MTLDTESIAIRSEDHELIVSISVRSDVMSAFRDFDGCGSTLSEAFLDLSDQLQDVGM
jgi:hypothetical protein